MGVATLSPALEGRDAQALVNPPTLLLHTPLGWRRKP